jgi:hypothetical protein
MCEALWGGGTFGTHIALVQESVRISFDLNDLIVSDTHLNGTTTMIHSSTMRLMPTQLLGHIDILFKASEIFRLDQNHAGYLQDPINKVSGVGCQDSKIEEFRN